MEKIKFETEVLNKGNLADGLINNNYLVLFDEKQDDFAQVFGFTVKHSSPEDDIKILDKVIIDDNEFTILEISENTNEKLKENTHIAFHIDRDFDGPAQVLLKGDKFPEIKIGTKIKIVG